MKLWLDDWRLPPGDDWWWAKTVQQAKTLIEHGGEPFEFASLDHDLGACPACMDGCTTPDEWLVKHGSQTMPNCEHVGTGYTLVCWMEETGRWPQTKPVVHSLNSVGRKRMQQAIDHSWSAPPPPSDS